MNIDLLNDLAAKRRADAAEMEDAIKAFEEAEVRRSVARQALIASEKDFKNAVYKEFGFE